MTIYFLSLPPQVAPRESSQLEASGGQLAFKSTAAKWAGSVGGYATYHTKSTTRTLNPTGGGRRSSSGGVSARGGGGGAVPTEHYGRWLEPGVSREGSRKGFDEGPSEISGRLQTHRTFKKGDQVRARAPDQKAAWFNATIVGVERDPSGDPAKHTCVLVGRFFIIVLSSVTKTSRKHLTTYYLKTAILHHNFFHPFLT